MHFPRASGILLPLTSLPGRWGIGTLGEEAYRFVDFLVQTGQRLWEILPLGPTGSGHSPYQSVSVFAGNPLLISLERLGEENLLEPSDLAGAPSFPEHRVDYERVSALTVPLLKRSWEIFRGRAFPAQRSAFATFCEENTAWLEEYALFMAVKEAHQGAPWLLWDEEVRRRDPEALERWGRKLEQEVLCHKYIQFLFFRQFSNLKRYCRERGVGLIGDLPHFVALDSVDVWSHRELFSLDATGMPTVVSGVPPDFFSATGQLWGNPLYRWEEKAQECYAWWTARLRALGTQVDIIRVDHFRGFEKYWEVPAGERTAVKGRWVPGPGASLFEALREALGDLPLIAEDLGVITPEVTALRKRCGFPGMRVLQFAFGGDSATNDHQPHNFPRRCVVYTGTHDTDTIVGWFRRQAEGREQERQRALRYLGTAGQQIHWDFIRLALSSVADTAIIPLQDVLGLGSDARMNTPGTTQGNWEWRFPAETLNEEIAGRLQELTTLYGR